MWCDFLFLLLDDQLVRSRLLQPSVTTTWRRVRAAPRPPALSAPPTHCPHLHTRPWITSDRTVSGSYSPFDRRRWFVARGQQCCRNLSACQALTSDGRSGSSRHLVRSSLITHPDHTHTHTHAQTHARTLLHSIQLRFRICKLITWLETSCCCCWSNRKPVFWLRGFLFFSLSHCRLTDVFSVESLFNLIHYTHTLTHTK